MKFEEFKTLFFKNKIGKDRVDRMSLINTIKNSDLDYKSLKKFYQRLKREIPSINKVVETSLNNNQPFPVNYSDLRKNNDYQTCNSIKKQINWNVLSFIENVDTINKFLEYSNTFQISLLKGNYIEARVELKKIQNEIGVSFWTMENQFVLDEYEFGAEKNWETRNSILSLNLDIYVSIICDFLSKKAEKRINFSQFNNIVDNWEDQQSKYFDKEDNKDIYEYIKLHVNYFSHDNYEEILTILHKESKSSLIDRYILLKKLIINIIAKNDNIDDIDFNAIKDLNSNINDIEIKQILIISEELDLEKLEVNEELLKLIDSYTGGNYEHVYNKSYELLNAGFVNYMELYEIYAKSLIEEGVSYKDLNNIKSISNTIGRLYYNILSKNDKMDESVFNLIKIIYTFNNSSIGYQIYSFLQKELNWENKTNLELKGSLHSKFVNPSIVNQMDNIGKISLPFLERIIQISKYNLTAHVYLNGLKKDPSIDNELYNKIPIIKRNVYISRQYMSAKNYEKAVEMYESMLVQKNVSIINKYEIVSNLIFCYWYLNDLRKCVEVYVNSFLLNKNLVKKMPVILLVEKIISQKFKGLGEAKLFIELPIIFEIGVREESQKVHWAYRLFLMANKVEKPSEINYSETGISTKKIIYFLDKVCIADVMKHSTVFNSTSDISNERIRVCQILSSIDEVNIKVYTEEISELTQKIAVSRVIKRIDESKIYVNDTKLKNYFTRNENKSDTSNISIAEKTSFLNRDSFIRYLALSEFVKTNDFRAPIMFITQNNEGNVTVYENQSLTIFKLMFLELRDHFLFNNEYGLDAYLSTRIRHGILLNQIRNVFEAESLMTSQNDGVYSPNESWGEKLSYLDEEIVTQIQDQLSIFSKKIDELSKMIKDEWIQVKTERRNEKPNALFSYNINDLLFLSINQAYKNIDNYEDFIDLSIKILWHLTENNLQKITAKLKNEVKSQFNSITEELKERLLNITERSNISELLSAINISNTNIQTKIDNIALWFKRSESNFDGELSLDMLIETSIAVINNIYPLANFQPLQDLNYTFKVYGEVGINLIDIFKILLENMLKHSLLDVKNLVAVVSSELEGNFIKISFTNNLSPKVDLVALEKKLCNVKEHWHEQVLVNTSTEGGTGFPKIKRILYSDLSTKQSGIDFLVKGEFVTISIKVDSSQLIHGYSNN